VVAATGGEPSRTRVLRYLPFTLFVEPADAARASRLAQVIIIGVPDDRVAPVCERVAADGGFRPGQHVVHLSGALSLDVLRPAEAAGAEVLCLHPLQVFPTVGDGIRHLPGSAVAVTARSSAALALGQSLARDVGGVPFEVGDEVKPLYHAGAVFCSNYLVVVVRMAEWLFELAGIDQPLAKLEALARAALRSSFALGPEVALTGPASRGDVGSVTSNLDALDKRAPEAVRPYAALAAAAAALAVQSGRLPVEARRRLDEELARWR